MPFRIEHPTAADAHAIATVHVRSWQAAYAGLLPQDFLQAMSIAQRTERWQQILARSDSTTLVARAAAGEVVAFISHGHDRNEGAPADGGEIWALYAHPAAWGQGAGRALMQRALADLDSQGRFTVSLWVLRGNERGIRFYEASGFVQVPDRTLPAELGGQAVEEIAMQRTGTSPTGR